MKTLFMTHETRKKGSTWCNMMLKYLHKEIKPKANVNDTLAKKIVELNNKGHQISSICFQTQLSRNVVQHILSKNKGNKI